MNIDVNALTTTMREAAANAVSDRWPAIRAIAEAELRKLAQTLEDVNQLLSDGTIDQSRATELVRMQQTTALTVLRTVQGLGLLTARQTIDAATRAAGAVVNRLVGFDLI
ncbi:MAG TPA: hypothetical protein VNA69_07545 [Thermoanaerobaculia bacterium]|nr:hypothetical protein [Thermoanaerobaculia bacterium]